MVPAARTIQYGYAQTGWKDLMTSYNGQSITYDEIGNPLTYRDGMTMTWTGRQLTTLTQNGKQNTYKYDVDGLRLEKTAGGVTTQYQYVNGQLLGEKRSNGVVLRYTYDALGALSGIQYKIKTRQVLRQTTLFAAPFPATWIRFTTPRAALSQGISTTHGATHSPLPMQAARP